MPVTFMITGADYAPEDLHDQTPPRARLIRRIPGTDRPDYRLAELDRPVTWRRGDSERRITHLVVGARLVGTAISEDMADLAIGIAYVTDQSVLEDEALDFGKCQYVAIAPQTRLTPDTSLERMRALRRFSETPARKC